MDIKDTIFSACAEGPLGLDVRRASADLSGFGVHVKSWALSVGSEVPLVVITAWYSCSAATLALRVKGWLLSFAFPLYDKWVITVECALETLTLTAYRNLTETLVSAASTHRLGRFDVYDLVHPAYPDHTFHYREKRRH